MKVFLGGTCNGSQWRELIKPMLDLEGINYFDPVVKDWTPADQENELREREECDYCLYVITPKMTGVYSIAEVIDDSNKRPTKTIFVYLKEDDDKEFTASQTKSLEAVRKMVFRNGGYVSGTLQGAVYLMAIGAGR